MSDIKQKKIWLVEFPTYQYNEKVKELAVSNGLTIIDAKYASEVPEEMLAKSPPKLTKIKDKKD